MQPNQRVWTVLNFCICFFILITMTETSVCYCESTEEIAHNLSWNVQLSWYSFRFGMSQPNIVKRNTCEAKATADKTISASAGWWTPFPGKRKLVSCCVASLLQCWIPAHLTPTLHKYKTTLCDCWILLGRITILLWRVKSEVGAKKAAETVLALFLIQLKEIPKGLNRVFCISKNS